MNESVGEHTKISFFTSEHVLFQLYCYLLAWPNGGCSVFLSNETTYFGLVLHVSHMSQTNIGQGIINSLIWKH